MRSWRGGRWGRRFGPGTGGCWRWNRGAGRAPGWGSRRRGAGSVSGSASGSRGPGLVLAATRRGLAELLDGGGGERRECSRLFPPPAAPARPAPGAPPRPRRGLRPRTPGRGGTRSEGRRACASAGNPPLPPWPPKPAPKGTRPAPAAENRRVGAGNPEHRPEPHPPHPRPRKPAPEGRGPGLRRGGVPLVLPAR